MSKCLLCCLLLLASVSVALADNINQILTVNLSTGCSPVLTQCSSDLGFEGSPAEARADFGFNINNWMFMAETGRALSWHVEEDNYFATFGYGGSFLMTGPEGLTFTGVVTSGTVSGSDLATDVELTYFGQWSNGLYADGSVSVVFIDDLEVGGANLKSQIAPEPSTFLQLGTGIAGL
jgi:prepilin-type processing-associated H-X9-DG protein